MQMNKLSFLILCTIVAISSIGCGTREWPPTDEEVSASVNDNDNSDSESEQDISNSETVTTTAKTTTKAVTSTTTKISTTTSTTALTTITEAVVTTTTSSDTSQSDGININIVQSNSWEAEGKMVYQFDCVINNASSNIVSSWNIEIPVGDAVLLQGWSAKYEISEGILNISPDEYNAEIAANGTFSLGFQLSTNSPIDISQARLNANGISIAPMP